MSDDRYSLFNPIPFLWCVGACRVCNKPVHEMRTNAEMNARTLPDKNAKHSWCILGGEKKEG